MNAIVIPNIRWPDRERSNDERLRDLLDLRARAAASLVAIDAEIAPLARIFADERGETMKPRLEDLRRRLAVRA